MDSFFGIGIMELFFIAVLALLVLGPERLPGAIREVMKHVRTVQNLSNELTSQFSEELKVLDEVNPQKLMREFTEDPAQSKAAAGSTAAAAKKSTSSTAAKKSTAKSSTTKSSTTKSTTTKTSASKPKTSKSSSEKTTTAAEATAKKSTAAPDSLAGSDDKNESTTAASSAKADQKTTTEAGTDDEPVQENSILPPTIDAPASSDPAAGSDSEETASPTADTTPQENVPKQSTLSVNGTQNQAEDEA